MYPTLETLLDFLYEPETKKKLAIVKALDHKNDWMTLEELHLSLGYTHTTLKKYLSQFEKESEEKDTFSIKLDKKRGYLLEIKNIFRFGQYYRDILFDMWPVQFLTKLILHNKVSKDFFPLEFFISDSTLKSKIKDFKQVTAFFNINLKIRNGFYSLEGNEANIRRLSENFFWEFFKGNTWPFKTINEKAIKDKTERLLQKAIRPFSLIDKRRIHYTLAIQEIRTQCGQFFEVSPAITNCFSILKPFIKDMQQIKSLFLNTEEFYYFYFWLATKPRFYSYFNSAMRDYEQFDTNTQLNIKILKFITKTLGSLTEIDTNIVFNYLVSTHMNLILFKNCRVINDTKMDFFNKKNMQPFINKIMDLIEEDFSLTKENKEFLSYHYSVVLSVIYPPTTFSRKINISFCTDLEPLIEKKLLRILTDYFSNIVNVAFYSGINGINEPIDLVIHTALNPSDFLTENIKDTLYVDTRFLYNRNLSPLLSLINQYLSNEIVDFSDS